LLGGELLALSSPGDCQRFLHSAARCLDARIDFETGRVEHQGKVCHVRNHPVGSTIPTVDFPALPDRVTCRAELLGELGLPPEARIVLCVHGETDTAQVAEDLRALEHLLDGHEELRAQLGLILLTVSTGDADATRPGGDDRGASLARRIEERFARGDWHPFLIREGSADMASLGRHLRAADVCYLSSLHDRLDELLRAYLGVRDDDHGVIMVTRFATGLAGPDTILAVNPYNPVQVAEALLDALAMLPDEQSSRLATLRQRLESGAVHRWAGGMIADAAALRPTGSPQLQA
jgi:trehalose 6-phosphate synthase